MASSSASPTFSQLLFFQTESLFLLFCLLRSHKHMAGVGGVESAEKRKGKDKPALLTAPSPKVPDPFRGGRVEVFGFLLAAKVSLHCLILLVAQHKDSFQTVTLALHSCTVCLRRRTSLHRRTSRLSAWGCGWLTPTPTPNPRQSRCRADSSSAGL